MSVVTDYIDRLNDIEKPILNHLRDLVYEVVPSAEEAFSYGVPGWRYKDKYMLSFASNKKFMSIYPGAEVIEVFKDDLKPFRTTKGTISFTPDQQLSDELLQNIIQLCRDEIERKLKNR